MFLAQALNNIKQAFCIKACELWLKHGGGDFKKVYGRTQKLLSPHIRSQQEGYR